MRGHCCAHLAEVAPSTHRSSVSMLACVAAVGGGGRGEEESAVPPCTQMQKDAHIVDVHIQHSMAHIECQRPPWPPYARAIMAGDSSFASANAPRAPDSRPPSRSEYSGHGALAML
jgi:hypothetical protein